MPLNIVNAAACHRAAIPDSTGFDMLVFAIHTATVAAPARAFRYGRPDLASPAAAITCLRFYRRNCLPDMPRNVTYM